MPASLALLNLGQFHFRRFMLGRTDPMLLRSRKASRSTAQTLLVSFFLVFFFFDSFDRDIEGHMRTEKSHKRRET